MIKLIIYTTIGVLVGVFLQQSSPEISFTYSNMLIKLAMWKVVTCVIIITLMINILIKLAISNWLKNRRTNKSLKYGQKTFFSLVTGNLERAEHFDNKLNTNNNNNFSWLKLMFSLIKAELYYNQTKYEQSLKELLTIQQQFPKQKLVLLKLASTYDALQDWHNLIKLLPTLKKLQVYEQIAYQQIEIKAYKAQLTQLVNSGNTDLVTLFYKQIPKPIKQNPQFIAHYVNYLLTTKNYDVAENTIKINLSKNLLHNNLLSNNHNNFIDNLIKLYGLIKSNNINQQIKAAENWLTKHPNNSMLLLSLGRLCINAELWGKAKNYLERAIHIHEDPACYAELGRLENLLGNQQKSLQCYQKLLSLEQESLLDS